MARQVQFNDLTIDVPDDATDDEVASIISTKEAESKVKPFEPGLLEKGGRYLADWGQGIRDAATAPGGGPTGLGLVDAAAGVADFGASAAVDALGAVPALAAHAFGKARGGNRPYAETREAFTRQPTTPVGQAITNTLGATMRPVGDALTATGANPDVAAMGMDAVGTLLDVVGMGAGARAAKAGVRAAKPDMPAPTPDGRPLRPYGSAVEKGRTMGYRILPSQARAGAQKAAPAGEFSMGYGTPGFFREGFAGPDLRQMALIDNQKRTNAFAAKELGISEITPQGLALARNPHNTVFNEAARSVPTLLPTQQLFDAFDSIGAIRRNNPGLSTTPEVERVRERMLSIVGGLDGTSRPMSGQQVLDAIRELRKDASTEFQRSRGATGGGGIEAEQAAFAYRQAADALEEAFIAQAGALDPSFGPRLKDARTALAKIHNVEDALDGTNVDALRLAKLGDKFPLSGYLADIAELAREFPNTMESATGISLPIPSELGAVNYLSLAARRHGGRSQGPRLLRDDFQERLGASDPTYDPRPGPTPVEGSPFTEYTPPSPDAPGGARVMPPAAGGGPGLDAIDPMADFDALPPAEARIGDLVAETPPPIAGDVDFAPTDLAPVGGGLAADLMPPPADFTVTGGGNVMDQGLDFAPDPAMYGAPIVRGGGTPGTVADSPSLEEALLGEALRGRPLNAEDAMSLAPDDVRQPFVRPAPGLGEDLGTGFGEPPANPLLEGPAPPLEDEWIPGVGPWQEGPQGPFAGAEDAVLAELLGLPAPQGKLPPPQPKLPAPAAGPPDRGPLIRGEPPRFREYPGPPLADILTESEGIIGRANELLERIKANDAAAAETGPARMGDVQRRIAERRQRDEGAPGAERRQDERRAPAAEADPESVRLARDLTAHRETKPRPIAKMYGSKGPTPEQAAKHAADVRKWEREQARLSREHKRALREDNEAYRDRQKPQE